MEGALYNAGLRVVVVNVDPPSIATVTETDQDVTVTGVRAGDVLLAVAGIPTDARYHLRRAVVQANDTVRLSWANETAGTVNPAAVDLTFVFLPLGSRAKVGFPMGYAS